jgi:ATP-dependent DNA ligase
MGDIGTLGALKPKNRLLMHGTLRWLLWGEDDGDPLFQVCSELGHEGVVAKRLDAPYLPGIRSRTWLKRKCPAWKRDHAPRRRPRVPA